MPIRRNALARFAVALLLGLVFTAAASATAQAAAPDVRPSVFLQCPTAPGDPDTYALCATARCWVLDGVAYCKCEIENGRSISLPFHYRDGGQRRNVCTLLKDGVANGFTVSTYSTPRPLEQDYRPAVEKLGPPLAIYTCGGPVGNQPQAGYSAQCDGGICFNSTTGKEFPGLGPIGEGEIVCSCPPVPAPKVGFQMAGPWHCRPGARDVDGRCCDREFHDRFCNVSSVSQTGTEIMVGAVTGIPALLSRLLDGKAPKINRCIFQ